MAARGTVEIREALLTRAAIREGAASGRKVRLHYVKRSGEPVQRDVSPYSYRGHLFYAKHKRTKSFVTDHIVRAEVVVARSTPDYPVEV